ncbi:MAG: hypothetical protein H7A01_18615 [Hahellaceae bacterium]|jgi:hypothetical protein|nr:hypothetical protein [Hahellaceae bacterium]MCP5213104.1 hypothetical protein [Hahellaceae bacterium]
MTETLEMHDYVTSKSPIEDLNTRIKVKRGFFARDWVDVKTFEFADSHCVIKTDEIYEINSPITLSFHLKLDLDDIVIDEFVGKVKKKKKDCSCFHYYIDFKEGKGQDSEISLSKIRQIGSVIKKKRNLKAKINSVSQRNS